MSQQNDEERKKLIKEAIDEFIEDMYKKIGKSLIKKLGWALFAVVLGLIGWAMGLYKF